MIQPDGLNGKRIKLRKRTMKIGTWNIRGLRNKEGEIIRELENRKQNIMVLTETKKKGNGMEIKGSYIHLYSGVQKHQRAKRGVSVLIKKKLQKYITSWEPIDENLIKVNISLYGHKTTVIGVYAISEDEPVHTKENFFNKLNDIIEGIGNTREIIIAGDFNSRTGQQTGNKIIGPHGENIINDNGLRLINICEQNSLQILNGFYKHKEIHKYTWHQETLQIKSIIDYIIVRQKTRLKTQDVRAYRGAAQSDHYLVNSKIVFPYRDITHKGENINEEENIKTEVKIPKYNLHSLENESTVYLYKKRLDEKLTETHFDDTEAQYKYINNALHEAAKEALGEEIKCKKKKSLYYFDTEVEKEAQIKKEKYLKWLNTQCSEDKIELRKQQAKVRKMVTEAKNKIWETTCNKVDTLIGGKRSSEAWKILRKLRQNSKDTQLNNISIQTWEKYFKELLTENRKEYLDTGNNDIEHEEINGSISLDIEIVKNSIKNLKKGSATGSGGIPSELVMYGTDKLHELLRNLFEKCLNGEAIPEDWKVGYISTIHKKGRKDECQNYRGITVTNVFSRLYGKIIKHFLEAEFKGMEAEEQAGFRVGRSTIDHLFCLQQIIEKKKVRNQPLHLVFVDIEKAYDNIPLCNLWRALKTSNISSVIIKAIQNLYENSTAKIKVQNYLSPGFKITKGLRQGCCLSPTLYKIYTENALKEWKRKCKNMGIPVNDITIYSLQFADDQLILAQDIEDIEYITRKLIEEYKKWGLQVNKNKTKYMVIGDINQDLTLEEGMGTIKHTEAYKYLGVTITQEGKQDKEINARINAGKYTIGALNGILWDQQIRKETKRKIFNTIIRSIITYGSEVWTLKSQIEKRLMATEMDFWRRSAGISRREKIRNEVIRKKMDIKKSIIDFIEGKQLLWYGHTKRMSKERLPQKIMEWEPTGRKKRGRPPTTWIQGIQAAIRRRNIEENLWANRQEWRMKIK